VRETPSRRWARHLALPVFAAALVAALPIATTGSGSTSAVPERWTPLTPVNVAFGKSMPKHETKAQLLSFNDFHGNIDPPSAAAAWSTAPPLVASSTSPPR